MARIPAWYPGLDIIEMPYLRDGLVILTPGRIHLGTRPLTPIEAAGRDARLMVREGLADVLEWLGKPVYTEPTSKEILDEFRGHRIAQAATDLLRRSGY